jgi:tetratricopeptide (TPR) repeat protein
LAPYEALVQFHLERDHSAKTERAARDLLERFPDHAATLEVLSDCCQKGGETAQALHLMQRALHANPLDRRLRLRVARAHAQHARTLILVGQFEEARRELQSVAAFEEDFGGALGALRAVLEFKAKNATAAEEALTQAAQVYRPPLVLAFLMLVEATRVKLPPALKKRFDQDFKSGLAASPDAQAAIGLLRYLVALDDDEVSYLGQKTHRKKIIDYAVRAAEDETTDDRCAQIVALLIDLEAYRQATGLARKAQYEFQDNAFFPYFEAVALLRDPKQGVRAWRVEALLNEADHRAKRIPADDKMRALLEQIQERRREAAEADPFGAMFDRILDTDEGDAEFVDDSFYEE